MNGVKPSLSIAQPIKEVPMDSYDILAARLKQIRSLVTVLQIAQTEAEISGHTMSDALWGIEALANQAVAAMDADIDSQLLARGSE